MKKMLSRGRQFMTLSVLAVLLVCVFLIAKPSAKTGQPNQDVPNEEREREVAQLIAIVRDEQLRQSDSKKVVEAIQQLGRLRAAEAIDALTKLLTFSYIYEWEHTPDTINEYHIMTEASRYPALGALMEIGRPSLPALTEVLKEEEPGSLASNNAMEAVLFCFRDDPTEGIEYFETAASTATLPLAAQRLTQVVEKVKDFAKRKESLDKSLEERAQLLAILRDEQLRQSDSKKVVEAIQRLGELQAPEAIDALTKLLTFRRTFDWEHPSPDTISEIRLITPADRYPALGALIKIGRPSLLALTEVLKEEEPGSLASNNAVEAVLFCFRENPAEGVEYFEIAANTAFSPLVAQRMTHVVDKMKLVAKEDEEQIKKLKQKP